MLEKGSNNFIFPTTGSSW